MQTALHVRELTVSANCNIDLSELIWIVRIRNFFAPDYIDSIRLQQLLNPLNLLLHRIRCL